MITLGLKYNLLTMYRLQNQSKVCQSNYHDEAPFFRETIGIIDECTKLMKEDRIYLRNKIKDYLKQLKENRPKEQQWQNEQVQLLIHIFVEANKKKSLNKIQKEDKVMDWLQIKLRKFIDNNKKQRHKKEVQSFRKIKGLYPKRNIQSPSQVKKSLQKSRQNHTFIAPKLENQINKLSFNIETKKNSSLSKYSLGKNYEKSPNQSRKTPHNASYSNKSFYKQFQYLKKGSKSRQKQQNRALNNSSLVRTKFAYPQTKPSFNQLTKLNKSLDTSHHIERKTQKQSKVYGLKFDDRKKDEKLKNKTLVEERPVQASLTKHQIQKLTQLFSHHLNSQQKKENDKNRNKPSQFLIMENYPQKIKEESERKNVNSEAVTQRPNANENINRYQYSANKIDQMLRNSKNILAQFEHSKQESQPSSQLPSILFPQYDIPKSTSNDDIFTPPDFLAQCRKFMFSSSKKHSEQDFSNYQQVNRKPTTFTQILNEQKQKSIQKVFKLNQLGINEVISVNGSVNISDTKPESQIKFKFKYTSIMNVQQLLLQIFKNSNKAVLDRYQIADITTKCAPEVQKVFQKYCNVLELQSNFPRQKLGFDFVSTVKYLYTLGEILQNQNDHYCMFICTILDISKKGYVDEQDIYNFIQTIQASQLEGEISQQIKDLLLSVFKKSCEVEGGNIATHWSIYYYQLTGDKQFMKLKEHLSKFQFQLDQNDDL